MRTLSSNLATENDKASNFPVVQITFSGITNLYTSGTFSAISGNDKKYLNSFSFSCPKINLLSGIQANPQMSFSITDKDNDLTTDLNSAGFHNKTVTAKIGDKNIAIADFFSLPTTKVKGPLTIEPGFQSFRFVSQGVFSFLEGSLFGNVPSNILSGDHLKGDVDDMPLSAVSSTFIDPTGLPGNWPAKAYLKIDNEILSYDAISGSQIDGTTAGGTIVRGQFGTEDTDHFDGSKVQQIFMFKDLWPTDVLLYCLLTTGDGSGHAAYDLSAFDSAFNDMGLGLSSSEVDIEGIERLGYKFYTEIEKCHFLGAFEVKDARTWLNDNIFKPADLFVFTDSDNKITAGIIDFLQFTSSNTGSATTSTETHRSWSDTGETVTQTEQKIQNQRPVISYNFSLENVINEIHYEYQIDPVTGQSNELHKIEYDASKTSHTAVDSPLVVRSPLIDDLSGTDAQDAAKIGHWIGRRKFHTWGNPVADIETSFQSDKWLFEVYDVITYSNTKIPDLENGDVGLSHKCVVVGQTITPIGNDRGVKYNLLAPEAYKLTTINNSWTIVLAAAITRTACTFRATADLVQNAGDGRHDFGGSTTAGLFYIDIKITPPGSGSTDHWISLSFKMFSSVPLIDSADLEHKMVCRYNSADSTDVVFRFLIAPLESITLFSNVTSFETIYVQWYDQTASGGEVLSAVAIEEVGILSFASTAEFDNAG